MSFSFLLYPAPPFRLDYTVWALRRTLDNIIDRWDGETYCRVLEIGRNACEIEVSQLRNTEQPLLQVVVKGAATRHQARSQVTATLEQLLGTNIRLDGFYQQVNGYPGQAYLASSFRGVKPPRFASLFEALVNAFACQQISLLLGIRLLNKLAIKYGPVYEQNGVKSYGFPIPSALAGLESEALRPLGFSRNKSKAIISLAKDIYSQELDLGLLASMPDEQVLEHLSAIRGVGRWTAEYVLLRGMGRLNVFPGDDVGARNHLAAWLGLELKDYPSVMKAVEAWNPYAGLIYFHLLLQRLRERGELPEDISKEIDMIKVKRVYDHTENGGGRRFLVERLWPRGIRKDDLHAEAWLKDAAPSPELRKWFNHDPSKWEEFQHRYMAELDRHPEAWKPLREAARHGDVVLLYSARDTEHNNALVLKQYLQEHL